MDQAHGDDRELAEKLCETANSLEMIEFEVIEDDDGSYQVVTSYEYEEMGDIIFLLGIKDELVIMTSTFNSNIPAEDRSDYTKEILALMDEDFQFSVSIEDGKLSFDSPILSIDRMALEISPQFLNAILEDYMFSTEMMADEIAKIFK